MGRVESGEAEKRLRTAVELVRKGIAAGKPATVVQVQAATGASYNSSKRILEAAIAAITSGKAAEALMKGAPPLVPKAAKGAGKRAKAKQAAINATIAGPTPPPGPTPEPPAATTDFSAVEVMGAGNGTTAMLAPATGDPYAHTRRFENDGSGIQIHNFDIPAHMKANAAELYEELARVKRDLQVMRYWVFGAVDAEDGTAQGDKMPGYCLGCGEAYTHSFPPRPSNMFGPIGTSNEVVNMHRAFGDVMGKITKQIEAYDGIQTSFFNHMGLRMFIDAVFLAIKDVAPEKQAEINLRLDYYQERQIRGLPLV